MLSHSLTRMLTAIVMITTATAALTTSPAMAAKKATTFETGKFNNKIPGCNQGKQIPWHLTSKDCETYLPNIHYADAVMNEQVMDLRLKDKQGERYYQIDRLIYPTIGAPNLFFRYPDNWKDKFDEFVVMLNLDDSDYNALLAKKANNKQDARLYLKSDDKNGIKIYLTKRDNKTRQALTNTSKAMAASSEIFLVSSDQPNSGFWRYARGKGMPELLKSRAKIKFIANKWAMKNVPPGFYDIRVDIIDNGKLVAAEFQYNAARIFPEKYDQVNASIINVTDAQASLGRKPVLNGKSFMSETTDRLDQFAQSLKRHWDKAYQSDAASKIKDAAFITFNGDVHNGGAPETLSPYQVANTYNWEAQRILAILKELPLPIFLTTGNHDGYVATGHMPAAAEVLAKTIKGERKYSSVDKVLDHPVNGANFEQFVSEKVDKAKYLQYLKDTKDFPGGLSVNVFDGAYVRYMGGHVYKNQWLRPEAFGAVAPTKYHRNYMLYDGFNQWKRTYGPLAQSWAFGLNHFVNLNSYDLRQHMRTGWGMYTVNYGGGISQHQAEWVRKEAKYAASRNREINLLAHHDPRGGHKGVNFPFYYRQVPYQGMGQVAKNFVLAEMIMPTFCDVAPKGIIESTTATFLGCMQDGLQEWMRPDSDFDCERKDMYTKKDVEAAKLKAEQGGNNDQSWRNYVIDGRCNLYKLAGKRHRIYSGYQLIDMMANDSKMRTLLLGHTHYNSLEVIPSEKMIADKTYSYADKSHAQIVPGQITLDAQSQEKYLPAERNFLARFNPMRWLGGKREQERKAEKAQLAEIAAKGIFKASCNDITCAVLDTNAAGHSFDVVRKEKELAILRLTSVANLTEQEELKKPDDKAFGFSILKLGQKSNDDKDNKNASRIEGLDFLVNDGNGAFSIIGSAPVDRDRFVPSVADDPKKLNPLSKLFDSSKALPTPQYYEIKVDR